MLEVGNLANATEDRSHFGAWAIVSSPLILSFDLTDSARMDRAWPIISNRRVLAVNQHFVGDPGRRVALAADGWQAWAKRMGKAPGSSSFAVFLVNTGAQLVRVTLPLQNVSSAYTSDAAVCARDLYTGVLHLLPSRAPLEATLGAHDSGMYCAWQGASCDSAFAASTASESAETECLGFLDIY